MSSTAKSIVLNDGSLVPPIAYGSGTAWYQVAGSDDVCQELVEATKAAIGVGYTHLDTARVYGNERSIGIALKECGLPREKLYVTTKIAKEMSSIKETLKAQLNDLGVDYVDLYLIHTPTFTSEPGSPSLQQAWKVMEEIKSEGWAKSIGVSNYRISDLQEILKTARVKPAVNQIEFHPYVWKEAEPLLKFMKGEGIALAAYGSQVPVVKLPGGLIDPVLVNLASKHQLTPGEVLLKWAKSRGAIVVTTSSKPERMRSCLKAVMSEEEDLTPAEIEEIDRIGREGPVQRAFAKHMST